ESQLGAQRDYGIRSLITMANVMREGLKRGDKYADAKDVIGINFLGFGLKELAYNENFVTRIVYSDYHNKVGFLTDKYSNYYVELPKLPKNKKGLPENYHDIWDITKALKTKFKDYEEVKGMQELRNSTALAILDELHNALSSDDVVYEALLRKEAQSLYEEQLYEEKIKGIEQGITETVVEMLREGFERDVIAKITKMPMDRVDEIASEYGV
ncbi:MAG: PD-(D/E)XK nuclease family transposase, partial [Defluviitaleaceae bacterium]|nr:PD-(D/E)XK nuclease family transposase [Defluviitaleaceae bacterium]